MSKFQQAWEGADKKDRLKLVFAGAAFLSPIVGISVAVAAPNLVDAPGSNVVQAAAVAASVALHLTSYRLIQN